ncbi:MAG: type II toxin-antitoxin system HicB family antitoxin [Emergencia sp.]|nr:type II toxin-antitoxin system HicB family antitoxin [Emergencia sp.]
MKNTMEYRNYIGSVEFSEEDKMFFGKVLGLRTLISYEGNTAQELIDDFHNAVDEYMEFCLQQKTIPEVTYKGSFNVRVSPELHKEAVVCALAKQISLNKLVECALQNYVAAEKK